MLRTLSDLGFNPHKSKTDDKPSEDLNDARKQDDKAFLKQCKEALDKLEMIRLAKLKVYQFRKKIGIPLAVILTPITGYIDYWLLFLQSGDNDGVGLTLLMLGGIYWWVTQPKRQYAKEYKKKILPRIARLFGDFTYSADGRIEMKELKPSKIVPSHDRYSSEDYFRGQYKGIDLKFSEIELEERRRSGKKTRYVTVFKGLCILLKAKHKRFFGHTIIDRNKNAVTEWFKEKSTGLERAEMVDPEFEKVFDAYTNDQVEARYLIDPLMIEKLNGLYKEYNGEQMAAAFYEEQMLILIASRHNHFEPADLHVAATNPESILTMKHEIGEILSIIDKLSLYDPKEVEAQRTKSEVA